MTDCCNKERQRSKTLSSLWATVTDDVLKSGYTSVSEIWELRSMKPILWLAIGHNGWCMPYVISVASLYFMNQCHIGYAMFSDINISQCSVATPLRCGGIFLLRISCSVYNSERIFKNGPILCWNVHQSIHSLLFWVTVHVCLYTLTRMCFYSF